MPKYDCKFNLALQKEFPFLKLKTGSESEVVCSICSSSFKVSFRGRTDAVSHINTAKHLKAAKAVGKNQTLDNMMFNNTSMALQAKELTFAYHTAKHRMSGRTAECNSKLITKCFEPMFTSGRTKTIKLCLNVNNRKFRLSI